ncbi:hypothetical protein [Flavobacterium sp. 3HN19-14]|uniref:hypothetical protein n=1 Tax=Flavobacterium sp. 3HN19-14 TaxID=3448133 RepID=UPI003EDF1872
MKKLMTIVFLLTLLKSNSQNLKKFELLENNWFINLDSEYVAKHDTIQIFKVLNIKTKNIHIKNREAAYFFSKERLTELNFRKDTLFTSHLHLLQCGFVFNTYIGNWNFDEPSQTISFDSKTLLNSSYKIIAKKDERAEIETEYHNEKIIFATDLVVYNLIKIR